VFGPSAYDPATGTIAPGAFRFPDGTASVPTDAGTLTVTWRMTQAGTSAGLVAADGTVAFEDASLRLELLSATVPTPIGVLPVEIAPCVFEPIVWQLAGSGNAGGLALDDAAFAIPLAEVGQCAAFRDEINDAIAGGSGSVALALAGDFTPPAASDVIFVDGFESP